MSNQPAKPERLSPFGSVKRVLREHWLAIALLIVAGGSSAYAIQAVEISANGAAVATGNPLPVTGTITTSPGTTGNGTAASAARVTIASDSTGTVAATQSTASSLKNEPAGNVADAAADSGNPIKVGCIYESTLPTYTTGQRANVHCDNRGSVRAKLIGTTATGADGLTNTLAYPTQSGTDATQSALAAAPFQFNGSTWDRQFTCTSQIAQTITAGSTTQIVALSGSTNIRVCSYQVGIATTGTFQFVSGTGTNCGTGTAGITPVTTLTAGNVVALSAGNNSIFRAGASNALCVAAVTGNVQVFVSYVQF